MTEPAAISPTAHYTGYVWARNGLSHPELASREGRVMFNALRPTMFVSGLVGGPSLERYLLARHRAIDALLEQAIASGGVSQVVEIACGLSPRGWRFARRYGDALTYVEADLPAMAERKRDALDRMGSLGAHHRVVELDALRAGGDGSLEELAATLDPGRGVAVVTEGLLGYLDTPVVVGLWQRIAAVLQAFPAGRYYGDLLPQTAGRSPLIVAGRRVLGAFVRGAVHLHFADADAVGAALREAGFADARLRPAAELAARGEHVPQSTLAQIIDARVG